MTASSPVISGEAMWQHSRQETCHFLSAIRQGDVPSLITPLCNNSLQPTRAPPSNPPPHWEIYYPPTAVLPPLDAATSSPHVHAKLTLCRAPWCSVLGLLCFLAGMNHADTESSRLSQVFIRREPNHLTEEGKERKYHCIIFPFLSAAVSNCNQS